MRNIQPANEFAFLNSQVAALGKLGAEAAVFGIAERWVAPVVWYRTALGFGEEVWIDRQDDTVIAWALSGADVHCEFGAGRGLHGSTGAPQFTLQPAGLPNHYRSQGPVEFAQFFVPNALIAHLLARLGTTGRPSALFRDDLQFENDGVLIDELNRYLLRSREPDEFPTRLEMEARSLVIAERLLTRHHGLTAVEKKPSLKRDWRLRRAMEYLEARLAEDVGIAEVASVVGLSPTHLTSLFRLGVGESPHRWYMRRRFERACEHLRRDPQRSITEVAHMCGFASSQHLAIAFQKRIGMTPSAYRREQLA